MSTPPATWPEMHAHIAQKGAEDRWDRLRAEMAIRQLEARVRSLSTQLAAETARQVEMREALDAFLRRIGER